MQLRIIHGLILAAALGASAGLSAQTSPTQPGSPPGPAVALPEGGPQGQAGPPPGFVAPAEPKFDENNAQRNKSQPGNNAPFWRGVRDSGEQAGYTSLPGIEKGVLIQSQTKYPGSLRTTAGEAWRQVRNDWIIQIGR